MNFGKAILNVKAFLPNDNFVLKLIDICNLRIIDNNWRRWHDFIGNYILISKNKKLLLTMDNNCKFNTCDLYIKAGINKISDISKLFMINYYKNNVEILFYDGEIIRFIHMDEKLGYINKSPLSIGLQSIRIFVDNLNINCHTDVTSLHNKVDMLGSFMMVWPPSPSSKEMLINFNKYLTEKILKDCEVL